MGKVRGQSRWRTKARASANPIARNEAKDEKLRQEKILPLVEKLTSTQPSDRIMAISAITAMAEDTKLRQMLLKEKLVQIVMKNNLNDENPAVAAAAYGLLRNLAIEQGYEVSIYMFRQDIFESIKSDVDKVQAIMAGPELKGEELNQALEYIENVFGLVGALVNAAEPIYDALNDHMPNLGCNVVLALKYLQQHLRKPEAQFGFTALLELCYALTEKNDLFVSQVNGYDWQGVDKSVSPAILAYVSGIRLNLYVMAKEQVPGFTEHVMKDVVEMVQSNDVEQALRDEKPVAPSADVKEVTESNERAIKARALVDAVQVSLEILGDVAELIANGDLLDADEGPDDEDDAMEDEDMSDEAYFEKSINVDAEMGGDAAVDIDGDIDFGNYNRSQLSGAVRYLLEKVLPLVVKLLSVDEYASLAMYTLNNVCWTLQSAVPLADEQWKKNAEELWVNLVGIAGASKEASVLIPCVGSLEAVARLFNGEVPVDLGFMEQLKVLCQELQASNPGEDTNLYIIHTIRLFTYLSAKTTHIERAAFTGPFLLEVIGSAPEVPADVLAEALNSLFDVFGDKDYAYDDAVFVKGGMLRTLHELLPKVRQAARKVDKKKDRHLRNVADEACLNLARFIDYKRKERK